MRTVARGDQALTASLFGLNDGLIIFVFLAVMHHVVPMITLNMTDNI